MHRLICAIAAVLILVHLHQATAYKWTTLKRGDPIPPNAIYISSSANKYVGRARHYDEVLPAEVYNSTYALINSCSKEIIKRKFEILLSTETCEWANFDSIEGVPENIVPAGNTWKGEPIYVARTERIDRLASVYLTSNEITQWSHYGYSYSRSILVCDDSNNWVDTSAKDIPKNTISGGNTNSSDEFESFVARLKRDCYVIPGEVIPDLGIATAMYDGNIIEATYCQVLVGDTNEYSWVTAKNGAIPDNAVPAGKKGRELMYIARENGTLGYIVHSEAYENSPSVYDVLTRNVK